MTTQTRTHEDRTLDLIRELEDERGGRVMIQDLRSLSTLEDNALDAALVSLKRADHIVLFPEDNRSRITRGMVATALTLGGEPHHIIRRRV